jgi:hypothetical protein
MFSIVFSLVALFLGFSWLWFLLALPPSYGGCWRVLVLFSVVIFDGLLLLWWLLALVSLCCCNTKRFDDVEMVGVNAFGDSIYLHC